MPRTFRIDNVGIFNSLEQKLSLSAVAIHAPHIAVAASGRADGPEGDPGDLPIDDSPIVLPPVPPSGPVGPG